MGGAVRTKVERQRSPEGVPRPRIDPNEVKRFFNIIAPGEKITFQTFTDAKKKPVQDPLRRIIHGHPDALIDLLSAINQKGGGIFWMVNRGDGRGRKASNVIEVRCPFIDLDGAPMSPLETSAMAPRVIVETSRGKYHAYWDEITCPPGCFAPMQIALARHFGADESVSDPPRVLRVPGFLHQKDEPFMTRIVRSTP